MSCTFWLRRKKKNANALEQARLEAEKQAELKRLEAEKAAEAARKAAERRAAAKKAVTENDNA